MYINSVMALSEDALENHFQVVMPSISFLGTNVAELNMRIKSVEIPQYEISEYEITKRGKKANRPNGVDENDYHVSFTFRADKYWRCYSALLAWMMYVKNNKTMAMGSDAGVAGEGGQSTYRSDFEIWSLTNLESGVPNAIWQCESAYPQSVSPISFNEESGDPLDVDVTMSCINIVYPTNY